MPETFGSRYLAAIPDIDREWLPKFIAEELKYLDYDETIDWYTKVAVHLSDSGLAYLGCNDRYFLLTILLRRSDALHPWLFDRCREVENDPDGHIDLWARYHYKSTIITFAGSVQEILRNPEVKIGIFSVVKPIAETFLTQVKEEFEGNENLRRIYSDVLYDTPKGKGPDGRPQKWSIARGLTVKRRSNPKEATLEAHGLIDGQPVGRHFDLLVFDDVVTQDYLSDDLIKKTTDRWEMADNLGSHHGIRKWIAGTRYHFADTYSVIIDRKSVKPRIYAATDDGTLNGQPVFLTPERWKQVKNDQRSTVSAQMLLNPVAGTDATFQAHWLRTYYVIPSCLNVYILCDPSKGSTARSDRTAIAVVGIDPAGNKYLLDGVCHRMKLSERYRYIRNLRSKWEKHRGVQLVNVGYERYGMQTDLETIAEYQARDNDYFELIELNTPRQGRHSKDDRIERLEPDFRRGLFYLPGVVFNPDFSEKDGICMWKVWTDEDQKQAEKDGNEGHNVGQIIYRPMKGPTKLQAWYEQQGQQYRVVSALKRRDEDKGVYDVTVSFIHEYILHPFAQHDDLIDATSRVFDIEAHRPVQYEASATQALAEDEFTGVIVGADDAAEVYDF